MANLSFQCQLVIQKAIEKEIIEAELVKQKEHQLAYLFRSHHQMNHHRHHQNYQSAAQLIIELVTHFRDQNLYRYIGQIVSKILAHSDKIILMNGQIQLVKTHLGNQIATIQYASMNVLNYPELVSLVQLLCGTFRIQTFQTAPYVVCPKMQQLIYNIPYVRDIYLTQFNQTHQIQLAALGHQHNLVYDRYDTILLYDDDYSNLYTQPTQQSSVIHSEYGYQNYQNQQSSIMTDSQYQRNQDQQNNNPYSQIQPQINYNVTYNNYTATQSASNPYQNSTIMPNYAQNMQPTPVTSNYGQTPPPPPVQQQPYNYAPQSNYGQTPPPPPVQQQQPYNNYAPQSNYGQTPPPPPVQQQQPYNNYSAQPQASVYNQTPTPPQINSSNYYSNNYTQNQQQNQAQPTQGPNSYQQNSSSIYCQNNQYQNQGTQQQQNPYSQGQQQTQSTNYYSSYNSTQDNQQYHSQYSNQQQQNYDIKQQAKSDTTISVNPQNQNISVATSTYIPPQPNQQISNFPPPSQIAQPISSQPLNTSQYIPMGQQDPSLNQSNIPPPPPINNPPPPPPPTNFNPPPPPPHTNFNPPFPPPPPVENPQYNLPVYPPPPPPPLLPPPPPPQVSQQANNIQRQENQVSTQQINKIPQEESKDNKCLFEELVSNDLMIQQLTDPSGKPQLSNKNFIRKDKNIKGFKNHDEFSLYILKCYIDGKYVQNKIDRTEEMKQLVKA